MPINDSLIYRMTADMNITRCSNELQTDYLGRVIYSALGLWCLSLSRYRSDEVIGISKKGQTSSLDLLKQEYERMDPTLESYLEDPRQKEKLSVKIRQLYESTGYLQTDSNNRNHLANYGNRVSSTTYKDLFIGIPHEDIEMNGLGVYSQSSESQMSVQDFLARDNLSGEEIIKAYFNICDFDERDINISELQFFNPLLKKAPSQSWESEMVTDYSLARKSIIGPYYRVLRNGETIYFAEENRTNDEKGLYDEDFRRLYFSLRKFYDNPQPVWLVNKDKEYVTLQLRAKLPAREYYLLLLSAWPVGNAFSTQEYLLKRELVQMVTRALQAIDINVKEF